MLMNGSADRTNTSQHTEVRGNATVTVDTPIAYYTPVAITPATIKWVVVAIVTGIWSLYTADWLYRPAKQTEFEALTRVVQMLQTGQGETSRAVERLTVAVDNLSGLVNEIRSAGKLKNAVTTPRTR